MNSCFLLLISRSWGKDLIFGKLLSQVELKLISKIGDYLSDFQLIRQILFDYVMIIQGFDEVEFEGEPGN